MKEDKEKSLIICNIDVGFLTSNVNSELKKDENEEINKSSSIIKETEIDTDSKSIAETGAISNENSSSKELSCEKLNRSEENDSEIKIVQFSGINEKSKNDTKENQFQPKLFLRPRKTETNGGDDSKPKKSKLGHRKAEKRSAIMNEIDSTPCNDSSSVCCTDSCINISSTLPLSTSKELIEEIEKAPSDSEKTTEISDTFCSINSAEKERISSKTLSVENSNNEDDFRSKSSDKIALDSTSLQSDGNTKLKLQKKKRRRRDVWWTKKRKKVEGNLPKTDISVLWRSTEINSHTLSKNHSTKKKNTEGSELIKKKQKDFAIPSPSLADISMKPAIPESTATSVEVSKPKLCLCRKKPTIYISGNNNSGDLYCQALDCIDSRIVGCCNTIPSKDVGLYRASEKAPYQMMCMVHQQRLIRHNCCPGCGLFCTQGKYLMCKLWHQFHMSCLNDSKGNAITCPHCGDNSPPKSVIVNIHSPKDPVFLPNQKPLKNMKSAKITIARGNIQIIEEKEDPNFNFPPSLFKINGEEILPMNGTTHILQRDKLAHLLNVACRSFSKLYCSNRYSYKNLYSAAHNGDIEKLLKIIASGLNPNYIFEDHNNQTALHFAAGNGHLSAVHILLQAKAQINVLDSEQNTPLIAAINAKHNDVVKYLIKCGADLILKGEDGMTPLHIAAKSGNVGACFHILNGTHLPNKYIDGLDDGGWTPMVWASEFNHIEVVRFLISKGADPLIKDAEQNIALHWAAFGGSVDIVEMFLNDGSDINSVNVHGDTPLHIAARQHKYSCVLLLLARGARSDVKNKNGELPRDCSDSPTSDIYKGITLNMEISALLTKFQDRTPKIVSNDISRGKERNQIQCVNAIDDEGEPGGFVYVNESCFTSKITVHKTITSLQSCKCLNVCSSESCNCAAISVKCWYDIDGRLKPDFNYVDPPLIFECNQACHCNRITCRNRVVQNGVTCRFQLFKTEKRGWGIKTLNLIPKGTFVCEYVGEIISDWEADHREDDSYLFDLENRDGETYCIDARYYGNFARFINHMCMPNLIPVHIFVDHQDLRFPRIAFFANRDILANEELGYNYGDKFWVIKWKSFTCVCGSEKCLYSENTIQTTLDNYQKKLSEENS